MMAALSGAALQSLLSSSDQVWTQLTSTAVLLAVS